MDNKTKKTAIVLGGTGLVGSQLLKLLMENKAFDKVLLLSRRKTGIHHQKIEELVIDFDKPADWKHFIQGDILYSAFGTTIKKAGSQENQYKVDYTYQWEVAKAAAENGVATYVLISSLGANPTSKIFYSRIKGELDRNVMNLAFKNIHILKPSLLLGARTEHRSGEKFAALMGSVFKYLPFVKRYRPIKDVFVAKAMLYCLLQCEGKNEFRADELFVKAEL